MTLTSYGVMVLVFFCEVWSFFQVGTTSTLLLDTAGSSMLQVNFDIDLQDIECRNMDVLVIDQHGREMIRPADKSYILSDIRKDGKQSVHKVRDSRNVKDEADDDELERKRLHDNLEKADGKTELDADWSSSHDGFKHQSFQHVIQYHEFTVINFFADWCGHCRQFAPMWNQLVTAVEAKEFVTGSTQRKTQVKAIRVNCVDFQQICQEQGVDAFPMIRLYKSDGTFAVYQQRRSIDDIFSWVETQVLQSEQKYNTQGARWNRDHEEHELGCNARGYLRVPRVPGHLEFFAGGGDQNLQASMTNVSHRIRHLSFSDPSEGRIFGYSARWSSLPKEARTHEKPLNNRQFSTHAFHQAWEHHLKVVRTVTKNGDTYQFTHFSRTAWLNKTDVPQARFYYDLEPFAIQMVNDKKRWYDLATSTLAITGGLWVMARVASGAARGLGGSARGRTNGLLT